MKTQEIEKIYLNRFRKVFPDFPPGEIVFDDSPDVIINGKEKIGIEITEFYKGDGRKTESEQVQIRFRKQVIEEIKRRHIEAGGKIIDLHISFDRSFPIRSVNEVVNGVLGLIPKIIGMKNGIIDRWLYRHIKEIFLIHLNDLGKEDALWMDLTINEVKVTDIERLNEIISDKLISAKKYQACDQLWLLICVDFWNPAQDQEIRIDYSQVIKQSTFRRIFIYKTAYEHFVELSTESYQP